MMVSGSFTTPTEFGVNGVEAAQLRKRNPKLPEAGASDKSRRESDKDTTRAIVTRSVVR